MSDEGSEETSAYNHPQAGGEEKGAHAGSPFQIEVHEVPGHGTTVQLIGELDMGGVGAFTAAVTEGVLLGTPAEVTLDFERLTFLDSSGLAALIAAKAVADEHGIRLGFAQVHSAARRHFELTDTLGRFNIV